MAIQRLCSCFLIKVLWTSTKTIFSHPAAIRFQGNVPMGLLLCAMQYRSHWLFSYFSIRGLSPQPGRRNWFWWRKLCAWIVRRWLRYFLRKLSSRKRTKKTAANEETHAAFDKAIEQAAEVAGQQVEQSGEQWDEVSTQAPEQAGEEAVKPTAKTTAEQGNETIGGISGRKTRKVISIVQQIGANS